MTESTISVTDAARHFADCVNRAYYQGQSFGLMKNGGPFARLVPANQPAGLGKDVAAAIASSGLPAAEAKAWNRDLKAARKKLKAPKSKWE
ncbi:MAG: type II toxin-antitoxin system Phd/YefM family antitoxin [Pirellulaceae bacterium]